MWRTRWNGGEKKLFVIRGQRRRQRRQIDQVGVGQKLFVRSCRQQQLLRRRRCQRRRKIGREAVGAVQPEAEVGALQASKIRLILELKKGPCLDTSTGHPSYSGSFLSRHYPYSDELLAPSTEYLRHALSSR